ncbi:MAG: PAS domain S-box protein [Comamonadaceae bacterium]|nr:PAS domain S-box protein [Comamonadaceae bacterium]
MNWVEAVWIGMCSASLALGAIHLFVWFKQKTGYAHLLFFALAVSATAFGAFELAMMRSLSPTSYATALRWAHVPLAMFVLSIVWFVYFHFGAGRLWLALSACGLRLAGLALNFVTGVNVNFREVSSMDPVTFWGGAVVSGPVGVANPWAIVPQMGNLLLVAFVVDAAVTLWRRGGADARRRATVVGGSLVVCIAAVAGFAALITLGLVHGLTIVMPGVFIVVVAMGYELGWDMIMAAQLATQLRASEQRFRAVVEAVPSAILVVDEQGLITLANQQAEAMFGYPRAELIGLAVDRLIPERFQRPVADRPSPWAAGPQGEATGTGPDLLARRKDGSEFPVEATLAPLQTGTGAFVLASVLDITERRRLEQATARQRDELAHLSRVAMLGELSGSLAHELNQPLTAILSNAQAAQRFMALSPPRIDKLPEILSDIVKADHRAGAVIQRLRAMLRKEEPTRQAVDLNALVEDSMRLLRSDLLGRHVRAQPDLEVDLPPVVGDRNQLQQVLLNLVLNACDAMEGQATDRRLTVRTRQSAQGRVEVSVADHGPGIPEADLDRLFDPFVTTKAQGLGLGLTICRSIVEAHGGRLWATNPAQGGATLHCELPATPG